MCPENRVRLRQLMVHYQPKVDLATGRTTAVEALIRWQHPTKGLVLPYLFIPLAERRDWSSSSPGGCCRRPWLRAGAGETAAGLGVVE